MMVILVAGRFSMLFHLHLFVVGKYVWYGFILLKFIETRSVLQHMAYLQEGTFCHFGVENFKNIS